MELEGSLPRSQDTATGPCPEPVESSPHCPPYFFKIHLNYYRSDTVCFILGWDDFGGNCDEHTRSHPKAEVLYAERVVLRAEMTDSILQNSEQKSQSGWSSAYLTSNSFKTWLSATKLEWVGINRKCDMFHDPRAIR